MLDICIPWVVFLQFGPPNNMVIGNSERWRARPQQFMQQPLVYTRAAASLPSSRGCVLARPTW
jgi:hypothetical protein